MTFFLALVGNVDVCRQSIVYPESLAISGVSNPEDNIDASTHTQNRQIGPYMSLGLEMYEMGYLSTITD